MKSSISLLALALAFAAPAHAIDERYKPYEPRPELVGRVEVGGSPAPGNLLILWGESFRARQPGAVMAGGNGGLRIRAAIEDEPRHPRRIITVRGAGYLFARRQDEDR